MMLSIAVVCVMLCVTEALPVAPGLKGFSVLSVKLETYTDLNHVQGLIDRYKLEIWKEGTVGGDMDIMIPPGLKPAIYMDLTSNRISSSTYISDVQDMFDENEARARVLCSDTGLYNLGCFNTLQQIYDYLDDVVENCPQGLDCRYETISTTSIEGRDLRVLWITEESSSDPAADDILQDKEKRAEFSRRRRPNKPDRPNKRPKRTTTTTPTTTTPTTTTPTTPTPTDATTSSTESTAEPPGTQAPSEKKVIWIDSLIHAREWLAGSTVLIFIQKLLSGSADAQRLLQMYDFVFMPVINPDGYAFSWNKPKSKYRMWRKNRRVTPPCTDVVSGTGQGNGVDLNRNFAEMWGFQPSYQKQLCSEIYPGTAPTSEPETQVVTAMAQQLSSRVACWLTVHTYIPAFMNPWGYTVNGQIQYADNHNNMVAAADAAVAAAGWTPHYYYGKMTGNAATFGAAWGAEDDFAYKNTDAKYVYTVELRGSNSQQSFGFDAPVSEIVPSGNEFWNAVVALMNKIEELEGW